MNFGQYVKNFVSMNVESYVKCLLRDGEVVIARTSVTPENIIEYRWLWCEICHQRIRDDDDDNISFHFESVHKVESVDEVDFLLKEMNDIPINDRAEYIRDHYERMGVDFDEYLE